MGKNKTQYEDIVFMYKEAEEKHSPRVVQEYIDSFLYGCKEAASKRESFYEKNQEVFYLGEDRSCQPFTVYTLTLKELTEAKRVLEEEYGFKGHLTIKKPTMWGLFRTGDSFTYLRATWQ